MGRKPKQEKTTINVVVNGTAISATLYPPKPPKKTWYAYWKGLTYSKSTGHRKFKDAVAAVEQMVRNGGKKTSLIDTVLSDEEFEEIQRRHYMRKTDPVERTRAEKSLVSCLEAVRAFTEITGVTPISMATPDDCATFQRKALELPKNWLAKYANKKKGNVACYSPNTVLRWSRALQAAFERANVNGGKKCVRGVVDQSKLLRKNPWKRFTWIDGVARPIRQFSNDELLSVLDYFEKSWPGVAVATDVFKLSLWTWARVSESTGLKWDMLRQVGDEFHFEIVGKWGVEKWARIPSGLYQDLLKLKTDSPFVFSAYNKQLQNFYLHSDQPKYACLVGSHYNPAAFADWLQGKLPDWAIATGHEHATPHVFRKTALQHARHGEDLNQRVAKDACVGSSVMMQHYVTERDEERRQASNRMFHRISASLRAKVAHRFGYVTDIGAADLKKALEKAMRAEDWPLVARLSARLADIDE